MINEHIEKAIQDCPLIKILSYDPKSNFPETISPGTIIKVIDNPEYIEWSQYDNYISAYALWYDQFDVPIKDLVEKFLYSCKDIDLNKIRFLPHINWSGVIYYPVLIKDKIPARLICTYRVDSAAYQMSLDAIVASKTWREEKAIF